MQIDAHQHFWNYNNQEYGWIDDSMSALRRDFLPEHLKPELDRNDFQGCIAVQARQTLEETRWLLELAERAPFILGVIGWVDLRSTNLRADLESLTTNAKLIGVRHIVQSEPDDRFLLHPAFLRGISLLEEFHLSYDILIYPKHLSVTTEFVRQFPRQRFVLDHLAKPEIRAGNIESWAHGIRELAKCSNVHCKVSGLVTEADWRRWTPKQIAPYLDVVFDCFGTGRLMFGSDWPVCMVAGSFSRVASLVTNYLSKVSDAERRAVLGENAQALWNLQPGTAS